jgi:uridine kinase
MEESKGAIKAAVRKEAKRAAKNWLDVDYSDEEEIRRAKRSVVNALRTVKRYLEDYDKIARGAVSKFVEEKNQEE